MKEAFDLDRELEQMKRETPEVPADFHDRWMAAVRKEAEEDKATGQSLQAPAGTAAEETQQRPETAHTQKKGIPQWPRILSVAAVAVFLIGGTLLTRGKLNPTILQTNEAPQAAPAETAIVAGGSTDAMNSVQAQAFGYRADVSATNALPDDRMKTEEAEEATEDLFVGEAYAYAVDSYAMEETAERSAEAGDDAAEAAEVTVEAGNEDAEAEEAAAEAGNDAAEAKEDTRKAGETKEQPETFLEQVGAFFLDMGRFILYALPVILGAAALAVIVALIDRRRKKGEQEKGNSGGTAK